MRAVAYTIGFNLAVVCALARVGGILLGSARSVVQRRNFRVIRFGAVEIVTLLEPAVLAATASWLLVIRTNVEAVSTIEAAAALAGGAGALAGLALILWTLASWRQLFVGHAVLAGQQLVTRGAYRFVRHPVYLGAILIWCGLSLCFLSPIAAAITVLYVMPIYLLYIRSEEVMMLDVFGEQYRSYRREVPMLVPRLRLAHPEQ